MSLSLQNQPVTCRNAHLDEPHTSPGLLIRRGIAISKLGSAYRRPLPGAIIERRTLLRRQKSLSLEVCWAA